MNPTRYSSKTCGACQLDFEIGEKILIFHTQHISKPRQQHTFHEKCINLWWSQNDVDGDGKPIPGKIRKKNCPLCVKLVKNDKNEFVNGEMEKRKIFI